MKKIRAKNIWKYILLIMLAIAVLSCEEKIDLQVHDGNLEILVVEGLITTDTTEHYVHLSYTGGFYLDRATPKVSGARVSIHDDAGNMFDLTEAEPGVYKTTPDVFGEVGRTYTLKIEHLNKTYEASSTMPRKVLIDSLAFRWDNYLNYYRILLYGQEPPGIGDCYMWHIWRNGIHETHQLHRWLFVNDDFFDGNYINGAEIDTWEVDFDFQVGDSIEVAKHVIGRDTYDFMMAVYQERSGGFGSMKAPANIPTNISNGAKGWFHTAAVTWAQRVIE